MRHPKRLPILGVLVACALASATMAQQHNSVTANEAADGWVLLFD